MNSNPELCLRARENGKWELVHQGKVVAVRPGVGGHQLTSQFPTMSSTEAALVAAVTTGQPPVWPREASASEEPRKLKKHEILPWVRENLIVRFNVLTRKMEIYGESISDVKVEALDHLLIERCGVLASASNWRATTLLVARENEYNPFVEYLEDIPQGVELEEEEWNSLDERMLGHSDPGALTKLQRQLVGTIKRALEPGWQHDTCLVLFGDQGAGKDSLLRTLFTTEFFFGGANYDPKKVDPVLAMYGSIAIGFAEVERIFTRSSSSQLKEFLTQVDDRIRAPYGRGHEHTYRHFTFWASTNDPHLLRDGTGNRRFPWVKHVRSDLKWIEANRDRIMGTLYRKAREGFQTWYTQDEIRVLNEEAQKLGPPDDLRDDLYEGLRDGKYLETSVHHAWTSVCGRTECAEKSDTQRLIRLLDTCPYLVRTGKRARVLAQGVPAGTSGNPVAIWSLKDSEHCASGLTGQEKKGREAKREVT